MEKLHVKITFTEAVLGTLPANSDLYRSFIASKSPDAESIEDEIAAVGVDETVEKGKTIFPRDEEGRPFLYDYQIKGFFKDTCGGLGRVSTTKSAKIRAYKKVIDKLIFVEDRCNYIHFDGSAGECQRPLRSSGPMGDKTSLAISEEIPAGAQVEFTILSFDEKLMPVIREWLDYGRFSGIGQWRNSGKGRFLWEELG